jgi:hypothetical protein
MADSNIEHPTSSSRQPAAGNRVSAEDVVNAVEREALARKVLQLLKKELRIQRRRLGNRRL